MPKQSIDNDAKIFEYAIIGAGPAGICAIASLIKHGASNSSSGSTIAWIDPQFKVGDFGTTLSIGSSVPGNTNVESYQQVNNDIFKTIAVCAPGKQESFEIDSLNPNVVCALKTAAVPLQHITDGLRSITASIQGLVLNVSTIQEGFELIIQLPDGSFVSKLAKRVIIAIGARPKRLQLPSVHNKTIMIDPNIAFIQTELANFLRENPDVSTVGVIGSSHSAALATMHLLKSGLTVKQFMDKEYKYAVPCFAPDGTKYTKYDNTGLKGDVAKFTKQILDDINLGTGEYQGKLTLYIGKDRQESTYLLEQHLFGCSHAIAAIGYESCNTLQINTRPLSTFSHNNMTTEFKEIKGLFGIGIAFPQQITAVSGELELAVGVGKFWTTVNNPAVLERWKSEPVVNVRNPKMNVTEACN